MLQFSILHPPYRHLVTNADNAKPAVHLCRILLPITVHSRSRFSLRPSSASNFFPFLSPSFLNQIFEDRKNCIPFAYELFETNSWWRGMRKKMRTRATVSSYRLRRAFPRCTYFRSCLVGSARNFRIRGDAGRDARRRYRARAREKKERKSGSRKRSLYQLGARYERFAFSFPFQRVFFSNKFCLYAVRESIGRSFLARTFNSTSFPRLAEFRGVFFAGKIVRDCIPFSRTREM